MAEAAELSESNGDSFDAEFEAAREAEADEQDETGIDDGGEDEGEGQEAPKPRAVADAEKLSKTVKNLDKALKAERREKRELAATVAEIQAQLKARPAAPASAAVAEPDPTEDPIGWMNYARKRLADFDTNATNTQRQQEATQAQQRQFQTLNAAVQEAEADFRADHADYDTAAKHLQASIKEELAEQGFTGAALNAEFSKQMIGIATRAIAAGKDPAEVGYNLAIKRGFGVDKTAASLQRIVAGQNAARSLGQQGGRNNTGALTVAAVSELKGAAFDAAFDKLRAQERRR
jgi:hypothetical protein